MLEITVNHLADANGTCLQHTLYDYPYSLIVKLFGKNRKGDYKTDAEWTLETTEGVCTIYNYKDGKNYCGKKDGTPTRDITEWHMGGHDKKAVHIVCVALEAFKLGYEAKN